MDTLLSFSEFSALDEQTRKEFPATLILRRLAVRQFPDGQLVALYRDAGTGKVVTFPKSDWSI